MLSSDAELLSVTVSVNELCPSDSGYLLLVTFGAQPLTGSDTSDCEGQVNTNTFISSGNNAILSVPTDAVSLGENEEYCYTVRVGGETGEREL